MVKYLRNHPQYVIAALIVVTTVGIYWQTLGFGFVNYDDEALVSKNPHVLAGLTGESVKWAFTTGFQGMYMPLVWVSHLVSVELHGSHPGGFHAANLLLHLASTLLLLLALSRMTGQFWRSAFVAALFAVHPLHVESVAWITERKDTLSCLFWMLTLLAYSRYVRKPGVKTYLLVVLSFTLGLLSKPMLVTLPFVLLLLDYWPLRRRGDAGWWSAWRRLILEKVPLLALAGLFSVIAVLAQARAGQVASLGHLPPEVRFANTLVAYATYLRQTIWPANLAVIYPHPEAGLPTVWVVMSGLLLLFVSIAVFRGARNRPFLTIGWLWFIGTLLPIIGLLQVGTQATDDRYTYIPLIGVFIMAAWGVPELLNARGRSVLKSNSGLVVLSSAALALVLILTLVAHKQAGYWRDSKTLFEHALACTTNNYVAHTQLGSALESLGRTDEAQFHLEQAVEIKPAYTPAQLNLGNVLVSTGRAKEAVEHYAIALKIDPGDPKSHYNFGIALQRLGRLGEAMAEYKESIRLQPDNTKAIGSLGNVLVALGRPDEAESQYRKVLSIDPNDRVAIRNLEAVRTYGKDILAGRGRKPAQRAMEHYRRGMDLARQGRPEDAIAEYEEALRIDPRSADAHCNIGGILVTQGKVDEAIVHFSTALRLNPKHLESHCNLAAALGMQGKLDEAIAHFRQAEQIKPSYAQVHANLAIALFYKKDYAAAWKEVHLCQKYGGSPDPALVQGLAQQMPDPGH